MSLWFWSYLAGGIILATIWIINKRYEQERYCDHGPTTYDSYCPRCGIDSE